MRDLKDYYIGQDARIRDAMESLSKTNSGMALVVTDSKLLIGVVTDGDVRRGLLNSLSLDSSVDKIMTEVPKVLPVGSTHQEALATMKKYSLSQIPLVDSHGRVVDLHLLSDFVKSERYENIIFINAGGRGQRLHPLTENCPKPLLQVGNKPILENIIQNFINHGFYRFVVSVNYRANMVMEYFRDGSDWDVDIIYIQEETPLGTAGSLAELKGKTKLPIIISNGDLLTNVD
ncbi:MAG TPA: sugar phosphate nucleotidyltransferase, partial [Pseudobdellovibrionaceae bacterium]|nr:sugar phosphate nucleotidyltransferase [Pseudobdellovibrionaceae bacterium]